MGKKHKIEVHLGLCPRRPKGEIKVQLNGL